jgi:hypothetical protein
MTFGNPLERNSRHPCAIPITIGTQLNGLGTPHMIVSMTNTNHCMGNLMSNRILDRILPIGKVKLADFNATVVVFAHPKTPLVAVDLETPSVQPLCIKHLASM